MLSSWNLHWSSSKNVCLGWCLRCGYSVASCRAMHSVSLLSWHTTYIHSFRFAGKLCKVIHQTCAVACVSGCSKHIHIIQINQLSNHLQAYCLLGVTVDLQQPAFLGTATYNRKPVTSNSAARNSLLAFLMLSPVSFNNRLGRSLLSYLIYIYIYIYIYICINVLHDLAI